MKEETINPIVKTDIEIAPNREKTTEFNENNSAVSNSTPGYLVAMGSPQYLHLPPRKM